MVAITAVLLLCSVLTWFVLLLKSDTLSDELKGLDNGMMIISIVLLAALLALLFASTSKVVIESGRTDLRLTIKDGSHQQEIQWPFTLITQWTEQHVSARTKMKIIYLTLVDGNGHALITFSSALGAIHDAPFGFTHMNPGQQIVAHRIYDTSKTEDIAITLRGKIGRISKNSSKSN